VLNTLGSQNTAINKKFPWRQVMYDDRSDNFWLLYDDLCDILSNSEMPDLIYYLVKNYPEIANDLYFELDKNLVKKTPWHEDLSKVVHEWVNPTEKSYGPITIEEADDGSGDGILTFPPEFIEKTGWKEGDTLSMEVSPLGTLILQKKD
jgi:hypothetical protein